MHIYESDPDRLPDGDFQPGSYRLLAVGNRGRLLDERRTPIEIVSVDAETGTFTLEVKAFEDRGARWQIPIEDIRDYQFERDCAVAGDELSASYQELAQRFDRPLEIAAGGAAREATLARLADARAEAARWLAARAPRELDSAPLIARREGDEALIALSEAYLRERELDAMDAAFASALVSNPRAGELVKGHAIVLAELGLCAYHGKLVRARGLFAGQWSKEHRARHLIARLALMQALWERARGPAPKLYRAVASERALAPRAPASFVSCTFSYEVAIAHFRGGARTRVAALHAQVLPAGRLLMSFLETRAMNRQFKEAEAVLIGDPANGAF